MNTWTCSLFDADKTHVQFLSGGYIAGKLGLAMCPSRSSNMTSLQISVSVDTKVK